jgi:hypothetical protein
MTLFQSFVTNKHNISEIVVFFYGIHPTVFDKSTANIYVSIKVSNFIKYNNVLLILISIVFNMTVAFNDNI